MHSTDFAYWLHGFTELTGEVMPTEAQWKMIVEHLNTVFHKVTPPLDKTTDKAPAPAVAAKPKPQPIGVAEMLRQAAEQEKGREAKAKAEREAVGKARAEEFMRKHAQKDPVMPAFPSFPGITPTPYIPQSFPKYPGDMTPYQPQHYPTGPWLNPATIITC